MPAAKEAVGKALRWLSENTRQGTYFPASPIGLYFAKLWYTERLYPMIFSFAAFQNAL